LAHGKTPLADSICKDLNWRIHLTTAIFPHHGATLCCRRPLFDIKPEHEARRKIIREWMSLPK
jgi:hypothetical protein